MTIEHEEFLKGTRESTVHRKNSRTINIPFDDTTITDTDLKIMNQYGLKKEQILDLKKGHYESQYCYMILRVNLNFNLEHKPTKKEVFESSIKDAVLRFLGQHTDHAYNIKEISVYVQQEIDEIRELIDTMVLDGQIEENDISMSEYKIETYYCYGGGKNGNCKYKNDR